MNILEEIALKTKERIEEKKKIIPLDELIDIVEKIPKNNDFVFEKTLKTNDIAFICEVKKASPSKGIIAEEFDYIEIAKDYEKAGANAISVLTEPFYFKGSDDYLIEIAKNVNIPIIRKDFTIDEYMIYEAKLMGASAILLICAILNDEELEKYQKTARSLGLSVLVEAHDEEEVKRAIKSKARIIGINNRNLKTFEVDINNSINLRKLIQDEVIFVSESGIRTKKDIQKLRDNKTDAVLIGETIMRQADKKAAIKELRGE